MPKHKKQQTVEEWFRYQLEKFKEDPEFQAELFLLIAEEGTDGYEDG